MMQISLGGHACSLIPVTVFREMYQLPETFGVGHFVPKDYTGLGSIENAGTALNAIRQTLLAYIPTQPPTSGWMSLTLELQIRFREELYRVNSEIGLKDSEITYAVVGLGEVCQRYVMDAMYARMRQQPLPEFATVYQRWFEDSLQVSDRYWHFPCRSQLWAVRLITSAYGRFGLLIEAPAEQHIVHDPSDGCPAEGFMYRLLSGVIERIQTAMTYPV